MSLKHGLLGYLNYKPATGYDIAKSFGDSAALFWYAKPSQIYRELDAMQKSGWLVSEHVLQKDKPNKRVYTITEQGKTELKAWLSSPSPLDFTQTKDTFLMRLFFSGETSKENTLELLYLYREHCEIYLRKLEETKALISKYPAGHRNRTLYWELAVSHGETLCKGRIEWIKKTIAILECDNTL